MNRIEQLIQAYGRACLESGALSEAHGRTQKQRARLPIVRQTAHDNVKKTLRALIDEINRTTHELRVQHKAALVTYGQHIEACQKTDGLDCTCGLDLLCSEDVFAPKELEHGSA